MLVMCSNLPSHYYDQRVFIFNPWQTLLTAMKSEVASTSAISIIKLTIDIIISHVNFQRSRFWTWSFFVILYTAV